MQVNHREWLHVFTQLLAQLLHMPWNKEYASILTCSRPWKLKIAMNLLFLMKKRFLHTNPQLFKSALQSGHFWIPYESRIMWMQNKDISSSSNVTRSSPVLLYHGWQPCSQVLSRKGKMYAPLPIFPKAFWVQEWIRIPFGYPWTGEFELNTDTCGRRNFLIRKEKDADTCRRGLNLIILILPRLARLWETQVQRPGTLPRLLKNGKDHANW